MTEYLKNISFLRREYAQGRLRRSNLSTEPMELFNYWLTQAYAAKLPDANAMSISTVDSNGQPYQRIVLLKQFDHQSMIFYTNLSSRKAIHLAHNPRISLHFPWQALERQVLVLGCAKQLSTFEVIQYFYSRPRNSQISAWVSRQSSKITAFNALEKRFLKIENKFSKHEIPLPDFWGGYRVNINEIEFWQGGKYRLHDRFIYKRKNGNWHVERLEP